MDHVKACSGVYSCTVSLGAIKSKQRASSFGMVGSAVPNSPGEYRMTVCFLVSMPGILHRDMHFSQLSMSLYLFSLRVLILHVQFLAVRHL